ncbi:TRIC cation channel family protein [Akkermansiaceae bacterium]|nr:TRIC cation channel family protein [Akkermansiaceae bacterium]
MGTAISLEYQDSWFIAAILGTITGTFGSVLADIICNEVPDLFKASPLCATCSFAGAWLYIGGNQFGIDETLLLTLSVTFIVIFRLSAVWRNWCFKPLR